MKRTTSQPVFFSYRRSAAWTSTFSRGYRARTKNKNRNYHTERSGSGVNTCGFGFGESCECHWCFTSILQVQWRHMSTPRECWNAHKISTRIVPTVSTLCSMLSILLLRNHTIRACTGRSHDPLDKRWERHFDLIWKLYNKLLGKFSGINSRSRSNLYICSLSWFMLSLSFFYYNICVS